jgi:hypothetical protein
MGFWYFVSVRVYMCVHVCVSMYGVGIELRSLGTLLNYTLRHTPSLEVWFVQCGSQWVPVWVVLCSLVRLTPKQMKPYSCSTTDHKSTLLLVWGSGEVTNWCTILPTALEATLIRLSLRGRVHLHLQLETYRMRPKRTTKSLTLELAP